MNGKSKIRVKRKSPDEEVSKVQLALVLVHAENVLGLTKADFEVSCLERGEVRNYYLYATDADGFVFLVRQCGCTAEKIG